MSALSWRVEARDTGAWVAFTGELTESARFAPLLAQLPKVLVFDLAGVTRINSCGVREWVNFMMALEQAGTSLALERCSVTFVAQLNMIAKFSGNGLVRSIFAPYICGSCHELHESLVELGPDVESTLTGPRACPHCAGPLEFDEVPETYLEFYRAGSGA